MTSGTETLSPERRPIQIIMARQSTLVQWA